MITSPVWVLLCVLVVPCTRHVFAQNNQQCGASFDMVFLVDSSGSIREDNPPGVDNYDLMIQFMKRIVQLVEIGGEDTSGVQIGVVIFGNKGHVELGLSGDRNTIDNTLDNLRYLDEKTNTSGGLWITKSEVLDSNDNRNLVEDVILVITDGNPNEDVNLTFPYAYELQNSGVKMFSVGVTTQVDENNVRQLSSPLNNGAREEGISYWLLQSFEELSTTVDSIAEVICTIVSQQEHCASDPCQNQGTCFENPLQFICQCVTGYYGERCESNYCIPQPCLHGGQCVAGTNNYTCNCPLGYAGDRCEIDYCDHDNCIHGNCIREADGYRCNCDLGYYGTHCENDYCDPASPPCQNGGTCQRQAGGFNCLCQTGYYGDVCQYDYCSPDPCQNGGECRRHVTHYNCSCLTGFYGFNCQYDYCNPGPCQNGGTCRGQVSGYNCDCVTGYYGNRCQNDYCVPDPCLNNGICRYTDGGYECECVNGYQGIHCAFPPVTTTPEPVVQFVPQQAESSSNNDGINGYLVALIVVIILLVIGLIILLLLCCCWSRIFAICCKPKDKVYAVGVVPFFTDKEKEVATAATQCDINASHPAPLKEKKTYRQDLMVVPTCPECGYALESCRCCPTCKSAACCGHHCNGHHRHQQQRCDICDPVSNGCPYCQGYTSACPECTNFLGYSSSGVGSMSQSSHPATLTYHNTVSPLNRPARRGRRQRTKGRSRSRDTAATGKTSDTESCSSRVMLIGPNKSRGATNAAYSSESDAGTRRSETRDYVYIPADCPRSTQNSTQSFLNDSFHSTRVSAGK